MTKRAPTEKASSNEAIRFESTVRQIGRSTILRLPADASAKLPSRGQVAVRVGMNGHGFQTVLEPDGRRGHWLKVDGKLKGAAGLAQGDTVALEIQPTKEWPEPNVPEDFKAALEDASDAAELWADITPMARWEWVRWINATKNAATRTRRIEVGTSKLRSGKRRPCCFDLSACTDPELSKNGRLVDMV